MNGPSRLREALRPNSLRCGALGQEKGKMMRYQEKNIPSQIREFLHFVGQTQTAAEVNVVTDINYTRS